MYIVTSRCYNSNNVIHNNYHSISRTLRVWQGTPTHRTSVYAFGAPGCGTPAMKKKGSRRVVAAKSNVRRRRAENRQKKSVKFQASRKNYRKTKSKDKLVVKNSSVRSTDGSSRGSSVSLTASTEYFCYVPTKKHHCWALTSLKAPFYESSARSSVDIVAVIDKSSSMRGEKIALVRETLLFVIDQCKILIFLISRV